MENFRTSILIVFLNFLALVPFTCMGEINVLKDPVIKLRDRDSSQPKTSNARTIDQPTECEEDESSITVVVQTDAFGSETSWNLTSPSGESIMSINESCYQQDKFHKHKICVTEPGCYEFEIRDAYDDGICCLYGDGYFQLYFMESLVATGNEFGKSFTQKICVPSANSTDTNPPQNTTNENSTIAPSSTLNFYPSISPVNFPFSAPSTGEASGNLTGSPTAEYPIPSSPPSLHQDASSPNDTSVNSSNFPSIMPTSMPTPKNSSIENAGFPSANPSWMPTSSTSRRPSSIPSFDPSGSPSSIPSFDPSRSPSLNIADSTKNPTIGEPVDLPTSQTKPPLKGPILVRGIEMIITGTSRIMSEKETKVLEQLIAEYITQYYDKEQGTRYRILKENSLDFTSVRDMVEDVTVSIQITNQELIGINLNNSGRRLPSTDLKITYTQIIQYRTSSDSLEIMKIVEDPFLTFSRRNAFVKYLKERGIKIFDEISDIDLGRNVNNQGPSSYNQQLPIIFGSLLIVLVVLFSGDLVRRYYKNRKLNSIKFNSFENLEEPSVKEVVPVSSVNIAWGSEDVSTIGGVATSIISTSDNGTLDYSYTKEFIGDENSLIKSKQLISGKLEKSISSSAIPEHPKKDVFVEEYSSSESEKSKTDTPSMTGNSIFSSSESFDAFFKEESSIRTMKEDVIDIEAPPGKLGVILQDPYGVPMISGIRENCPLVGKIEVGDKLIALDDQDISFMTTTEVSKLIGEKSEKEVRKLTILRRKKSSEPITM